MSRKNPRMPVLFFGHGSPMNALADNKFTARLRDLGQKLPHPKAILCISAHWMTKGTQVTRMPRPKTIHDFYGFPQALFEIQYPARGDLALADRVIQIVNRVEVTADDSEWGLDHGTWSVLRHIYPNADVPVVQLSVDLSQGPAFHYELGRELQPLRDEGVLVIGSGNIVHNLRKIEWQEDAKPHAWAVAFDEWVKERLAAGDDDALVHHALDSEMGQLSIPTPDHWYPLLYVLGARDKDDQVQVEYEEIQNASISMRSVSFGQDRAAFKSPR